MNKNCSLEKPKQVKSGVRYLYYGLLLSLISMVYVLTFKYDYYYSIQPDKVTFHTFWIMIIITFAIILLVSLFLILKTSAGGSKSKHVFLILFILLLVNNVCHFSFIENTGAIFNILRGIAAILNIIGFVLLYSSPSRKWFKSIKNKKIYS